MNNTEVNILLNEGLVHNVVHFPIGYDSNQFNTERFTNNRPIDLLFCGRYVDSKYYSNERTIIYLKA